jgi:hypothetical protein
MLGLILLQILLTQLLFSLLLCLYYYPVGQKALRLVAMRLLWKSDRHDRWASSSGKWASLLGQAILGTGPAGKGVQVYFGEKKQWRGLPVFSPE